MEIKINMVPELSPIDSGGGCCTIGVDIEVDPLSHPKTQQKVVVHEVLEATIGYVVPHDNIERIAELIMDGLEQLDILRSE